MKTFERSQLVKEMVTQLDYYNKIIINCFKQIAIDLSKQQALEADPNAIQKINFTANLDRTEQTATYSIIETVVDFLQGTVIVL